MTGPMDLPWLGSRALCVDYGLRHPYLVGSMYKGIASCELVITLARAGILSFFGSGGLSRERIADAVRKIQCALRPREPYGVNLLGNPADAEAELATALLLGELGVPVIEASGFTRITLGLVVLRAQGLTLAEPRRKIIAKVSHPEIARAFMHSPTPQVLRQAVERKLITEPEAEAASCRPIADDLCVEADSGGHTDIGPAYALVPRMLGLRDELSARYPSLRGMRVGAAGGIGTPQAIAAAFVLGADFVLTGSINQCTPEAGTSNVCKDILQRLDVRDTGYAPAGDQFEQDTQIQVVRRGLLFAARARHLRQLWQRHSSVDELSVTTRTRIEREYMGRTFEEVFAECEAYYRRVDPARLDKAYADPKARMAMIFRWYFVRSARLAQRGEPTSQLDYQIHCSPALGAFNYWARGTPLEHWRDRHVDTLATALMNGAAHHLSAQASRWAIPGVNL